MAELPRGTVTFLFTDIEGSTRLLHELGDAYADALADHRRALRAAFERHGGVEVDTQGDAFFVAFARATAALAAARDAQEALGDGPVRVRIGVHTGEPVVTDEGYVGIDVHRAARIAAVGHGGQVLVSQSTRDLAGDGDLRDLGDHRLKDLTAPERIYQLGDGEFPPLKSLNATNLPIASNPLVGRERELRELVELLGDSARLVTLTGAGGSGKTRLALQAAGELVDDFPGGVFFVPLAGVPQPDLVAATIAGTVGVRDFAGLSDRQALLVVDNFEHLLNAAPAIGDLLSQSTEVKVLATSRAPLRVGGEREYPVEPLPDDDAVTLLAERARAVRPGFVVDDATLEICRRLDGLPLALELAASRLRSLAPAALLERLDRRLPVLTSGRRDVPERQRTLRATIEWSYDLLEPELQRTFAGLGVFATFTLEAAEVVADADLDAIDALVEMSLLKHVSDDRYLMLETIRELALEKLEESGEIDAIRRRHAEFLVDLAERANLNIESDGPMRHDLVIPERDNIRAALEWAVAASEAELGVRLAMRLENFWVSSGDPLEGQRWFETLLALGDVSPWTHAFALRCLGNCLVMSGERDKGIEVYEQSLAAFRDLGDELRVAVGLHRVATNVAVAGEPERARALNDEATRLFRASGFKKGEAQTLTLAGMLDRAAGAMERAAELFDRSVQLARETGFTWWEQRTLLHLAETQLDLGRLHEGARAAGGALEVSVGIDDTLGIVYALALVSRAAAEGGDDELAGRLWGALEAEVERTPLPAWEAERDEAAAPIFARAGARFEAARESGRALALEDAIAAARTFAQS